ncbi:MAG: hypothetical protein IPM08_14300 [Actinomycetales bacterium]|nr:hypothetical protein [Actinomycetales bacterium]
MTTLAFPSDLFPAKPQVSLAVPSDWRPVATVTTDIAAIAPEVDGFRPNVIVVVNRRPSGMVVGVALDEIAAESQLRPQGSVSEPFEVDLNGRAWSGCDLEWEDPRAGRLVQLHLFTVIDAPVDGALPFLVQVTGSCLSAREAQDIPKLREVMSSVVVTPWTAS